MIKGSGFSSNLNLILHRYKISVYRLAEDSGLDRPNLWRISKGINIDPTRETVMLICYGLAKHNVLPVELDRLVIAAGYAPAFLKWKPEISPVEGNA